MLSQKLIETDITPALPTYSGMNAMSLMDEFKVSHLPVVDNGRYLGLISEDDIWNSDAHIDGVLDMKSIRKSSIFQIAKFTKKYELDSICEINRGDYNEINFSIVSLNKMTCCDTNANCFRNEVSVTSFRATPSINISPDWG